MIGDGFCQCGCGEMVGRWDENDKTIGRVRGEYKKFIQHHFNKTGMCRENLRNVRLGYKNPMWKGDKVSYGSLHEWIKYHKPKPKLCKRCEINEPHDLANVSGKYLRDINDFEWICRKCHMKDDGRLIKISILGKENWKKSSRILAEKRKLKTYCKRGHELIPDNIRVNERGHRMCKVCQSITGHVRYLRMKNNERENMH